MSLIAIIDDDPDIIDATSIVLMANGYKVATANNPTDGYNLIMEKSPALIILDVMMNEPDDGFFLAQRLRREGVTTPIIMYTSVSKALGFEFGKSTMVPVDDFVEKPITADDLLQKVQNLLKKK
ncbi:MAG: response regulator [Ignavibacteriales bacterium]|nr:MAG: response regulator [Ignavibacteriaceae bacterium]MBW7874026.1 response regulator [Ignavibacteria bacterium]MCZ2143126.1 response regulator [Ignavibacteriales bacterium]OQY73576.1 MAG: response regulator [Ignavibacteriales bacterium UTCHB3]MBV6444006.1 Transcriptional regulatory protein AfsQ1 [Ignavibacteriaceae bacterium]